MTPTTPNKLLSMSSPDSSPSRLPIRQKGSLLIPDLPTLTLPPLPDITNPAIKNLALTHSSNHAGQSSRKRDLIYNQAEAVLDNEKLEHVGDGLLSKLDVAYVAVIES
jgi:dsRNA-specific ribonuclease